MKQFKVEVRVKGDEVVEATTPVKMTAHDWKTIAEWADRERAIMESKEGA